KVDCFSTVWRGWRWPSLSRPPPPALIFSHSTSIRVGHGLHRTFPALSRGIARSSRLPALSRLYSDTRQEPARGDLVLSGRSVRCRRLLIAALLPFDHQSCAASRQTTWR